MALTREQLLMVETVADAVSSAWEGMKDGWNKLWG